MSDEWHSVDTAEPKQDEWHSVIPTGPQNAVAPPTNQFQTVSTAFGEVKIKEWPKGLDNPETQTTIAELRSRFGDEFADKLELPYYLSEIYGTPVKDFQDMKGLLDVYVKSIGGDDADTRTTLQMARDYYIRGQYNKAISDIWMDITSEALIGKTDNIEKAIAETARLYEDMPAPMDEKTVEWYKRIFIKGAEMAPMMVEAAKEAAPFAIGTAGATAAAVAATGIGAPVALAWVGGAFSAGFTTSLIKQMTGANMVRMVQQDDVDPTIAAWASLGIGIAQGVIEQAQFGKILKLIPGEAKGIGRILQLAIDKTMGKGGAAVKIAKGIARVAGTYTQEMLEEEAQYLIEAFGDDVVAAAEQYLLGKDVEYNTVQEVLAGLKETYNQAKEPILGMILLPGATGIMVDVFTPEAKAAYESGIPQPKPPEEVLLRDKAPEFDTAEEFTTWAEDTLGPDVVKPEVLKTIHDEVTAPQKEAAAQQTLVEEAAKFDTPEEFVESKGTPIYHGAGVRFEQFDDSMRGTITGAKSAKGAIWFTDDKRVAKAYSIYAAETGPVKALLDKADAQEKIAQRTGKSEDWDKVDELMRQSEELDTYEKANERREGSEVKEVVLKDGLDLLEIDAEGKTPQELSEETDIDSWLSAQVEEAKSLGKDGLVIKNLDDAVGLYDAPSTHYAIFDSKNIMTRAQLTAAWTEAHTTDEMRQSSAELQTDISTVGFDTPEEFIQFAHTMYDEDQLPSDAALREMYAEAAPETVTPEISVPPATEAQGEEDRLVQEAKKYKSAEEFVDSNMGVGLEGAMQHRPTFTGPTADDVENSDMGMPDFYDDPRLYETGDKLSDNQSIRALMAIQGNPEANVTIYRASPKKELRGGDWVTLSKNYAKGESLSEGVEVHSFKVKAKDIRFAGDSINEFGYYPESEVKNLIDIWNKAQALETSGPIENLKPEMAGAAEGAAPEPTIAPPSQAIAPTEDEYAAEAAARILEPQMIEPEKRTTKQQIRRSVEGMTMERLMAYDDLLKLRLSSEARGAKSGMKAQREIQAQRDAIKKVRATLRGYREDIKKAEAKVQKWQTKGKGKRIDQRYQEQVTAILDGLSMTKLSAKKKAKLEGTYKFLQDNEDHDMPAEVITELARLNDKSWDQMTPAELKDVHDGVMTALTLNDQKQKLRVRSQERAFEESRDAFLQEIDVGKETKRKFVGPKKPSGLKKARQTAKMLIGINQSRPDVVIQQAFGNLGVGRDVIGRQIEQGVDADEGYRQKMFSKFRENLVNEGFDAKKDTSKWIEEDVTVKTDSGTFTMERGQRISIYMHSLDQDNYESMLEGIGFRNDINPNQSQKVTPEDIKAIVDSMDEGELMWARAAADVFKITGEDQKRVMLEQNGWAPEFYENYMPKDTVPTGRAGSDVETETFTDQAKDAHPHRVGVDKRQLKQRLDVRTPIYINNIAQVTNDVIMRASAYVNLEAPLKNAHKLLNDMDVRNKILSTPDGTDVYHYLTKYLRDVAGERTTYNDLTKFFDKLRPGITKYSLGGNIWVAMKQALSAPFAAMYVKPKYLFMGMMDEMWHPKTSKDTHKANSARFTERLEGGFSRDTAEALKKNTAGKRLLNDKKAFGEWMMKPSQAVDAKTVSGVMAGAVRQAMDEFRRGVLSPEVQDAIGMETVDIENTSVEEQTRLAYQFADYVSNRTQPQFSPDQLSQIQRSGTAGKLISQFSAFTNQELNMLRRAIGDVKEKSGIKRYRKLAIFSTAFVANAIGVFVLDTMRDKLRGKDDEEIKGIAETGLDAVAGMYYGIRDFEKAVMSDYSDNVEIPIMRIGERIVSAGKAFVDIFGAEDGEQRLKAIAKFTDASLDLVMMKFGVPYVLKRTAKNVFEAVK